MNAATQPLNAKLAHFTSLGGHGVETALSVINFVESHQPGFDELVDRFGFSAPGDIVMEELGMTAKNCAAEVKAYMG